MSSAIDLVDDAIRDIEAKLNLKPGEKVPSKGAMEGGGGGGGESVAAAGKVDELSAKMASAAISDPKDASKKEEEKGKKEGGGGYDRWSLLPESTLNYGHLAGSKSKSPPPKATEGGFYVTTAINYTNGPAHMGHAYEGVTADAVGRYARLEGGRADGEGVRFVTGTDEHGEKVDKTAKGEGVETIELCNKYVTGFQSLNQRILIANDDYVRTTSARHKRTAQSLWKKCADAGDIFLDSYSGWYNTREETFVTDSEAEMNEFKDPVSGKPLEKVEEASYFFRMSKYHDKLVEHIQSNPEFIRPEQHRNAILKRLTDDRLRDLSVSRTSFSWGIPVPEGFDSKHVMYVWFDALSNYLTGVDGMGANDPEGGADAELVKFWPADVHIIGKDILWFHTVIWPTILMSAGLPLPKKVFAHGFVNDKEGKKMSKSLGNVVDPHDMLDQYPVDTFRWYLCKEAPYGGEMSFSEESLRDMHNSDLCDTLGNLIHRATNLCKKNCGGVVPDVGSPSTLPVDFDAVRALYVSKMDNLELQGGAAVAMQAFRDVNGWLTEQAPWHMKGDERADERQVVVRATLEAVYALSHLLLPYIPNGAGAIFDKMGQLPRDLVDLSPDLRNLETGTKIIVGDVLYGKLISEEEKLNAVAAAKKKADDLAAAQKKKKEKKAKEMAKSKAGQGTANVNQPEFTKVDIRVGKIVKVWEHPDAERLFCEQIDVGEEGGPREIASGLREHYALEQMQDRKVLVVCNLKAAKLAGFSSNGMVLAAKADGKVELVDPPEGAPVGERVFIEGLAGEPVTSAQMKKKKIWDKVAKGLKTAGDSSATWDGGIISTSAGPCKTASLAEAPIS